MYSTNEKKQNKEWKVRLSETERALTAAALSDCTEQVRAAKCQRSDARLLLCAVKFSSSLKIHEHTRMNRRATTAERITIIKTTPTKIGEWAKLKGTGRRANVDNGMDGWFQMRSLHKFVAPAALSREFAWTSGSFGSHRHYALLRWLPTTLAAPVEVQTLRSGRCGHKIVKKMCKLGSMRFL